MWAIGRRQSRSKKTFPMVGDWLDAAWVVEVRNGSRVGYKSSYG